MSGCVTNPEIHATGLKVDLGGQAKAVTPATTLTCLLDPQAREAAARPPLPDHTPATLDDLVTFSLAQEESLDISEHRRGEAVKALDGCNAALQRAFSPQPQKDTK